MDKDISSSSVDNEGRILKDISEKMEIVCPTCKGKGKITDPNLKGGCISYKELPKIECRTCGGEGWVLTNKQSAND